MLFEHAIVFIDHEVCESDSLSTMSTYLCYGKVFHKWTNRARHRSTIVPQRPRVYKPHYHTYRTGDTAHSIKPSSYRHHSDPSNPPLSHSTAGRCLLLDSRKALVHQVSVIVVNRRCPNLSHPIDQPMRAAVIVLGVSRRIVCCRSKSSVMLSVVPLSRQCSHCSRGAIPFFSFESAR
jgi:hypothetical protein